VPNHHTKLTKNAKDARRFLRPLRKALPEGSLFEDPLAEVLFVPFVFFV
jgi:hypothetical protein